MWFQADLNEGDGVEKDFILITIGTGHPWGDLLHREEYIGTLLLMKGILVLHYFLVEQEVLEGIGEED